MWCSIFINFWCWDRCQKLEKKSSLECGRMHILSIKVSRALKRVLNPGHKLLASLVRLCFVTLATFGLRTWAPPLDQILDPHLLVTRLVLHCHVFLTELTLQVLKGGYLTLLLLVDRGRGLASAYDFAHFPKTAWNWKNLVLGGASKMFLCRSATDKQCQVKRMKCNTRCASRGVLRY